VALDLAHHTVSFTDPEGLAQTITVQEPEMRDFMKTLKVGDEVAVTYTEALAISVEPASP
jgi:translation elongation factor P/translation initiation factor 5A